MRMNRVVTGLVAMALLGLAPIALGPSAQAAGEDVGTPVVGPTSGSDTGDRARPARNVTSKVVKKRGRLFLKGNVNPGYNRSRVMIQKKNCRGDCGWHKFDMVPTDRDGRYRGRITAPRNGSDFWRVKVKKRGNYRTSYSAVWRTFRV